VCSVQWVDPPELPPGQCDSTASVSALSHFEECPRRYFLGRYAGLEATSPAGVPASEGLSGADLGSQVHAILAGTAVENATPEAVRLAGVFLRSELGRRAARASRAEREFEFVAAVHGLVIRGQIDLWFQDAFQTVLVDYKTDLDGPEANPDRLAAYSLQLRFYAHALAQYAGRPVDEAWLYYLRSGKLVNVPLNAPPGLEAIVSRFRNAQEQLEFPLNPGQRCYSCEYYRTMCEGVSAARHYAG
jgi:CRISPR/Cas system-associated exonuclease Cas4 (RecB family)